MQALVGNGPRALRPARRDDLQRRLRHLRGDRHASTPDQMQRLIDVNYLGTYHAMRAALPVLPAAATRTPDRRLVHRRKARRAVHGRVLRRRSSRRSVSPSACAPSCVGSGIHLSVVFPISTETEFFEVMTRESGFATRAPARGKAPTTSPRRLRRAIDRPVAEVYPYRKARGLVLLNALAPGFCDRLVKRCGRPVATP